MPTLDHLILLVPSLSDAALAPFAAAGFTLLPGGTHADGVTANVLVPLPDGVYLELIAFVTDDLAKRAHHWWGDKQNGWIDWSSGPAPRTSEEVLDEIETRAGVQPYQAPVAGGRLTMDGKRLEWKVTFPKLEEGQKRGVRPFWCQDVSPREWRVPALPVPHPNGVTHVTALVLLATPGGRAAYVAKLEQVLGPAMEGGEYSFELAAPSGGIAPQVLVREPGTEAEEAWVAERGEGLYEVVIGGVKEATVVGEEAGARLRLVV